MGTDAAYVRLQCFYQSVSCAGLWLSAISHTQARCVYVCVCVYKELYCYRLPIYPSRSRFYLLPVVQFHSRDVGCGIHCPYIEANFNPIFEKSHGITIYHAYVQGELTMNGFYIK